MAESTRQAGRDHSKFDSMSTAELNEYLRQDSYCEDSNTDDILYIMEVLERREKDEKKKRINLMRPMSERLGRSFKNTTTPRIMTGNPCTILMMRMTTSLLLRS